MKNSLAQAWQSSTQLPTVQALGMQRSVMPVAASASVRTRAFDAAAFVDAHAGIAACVAATPCTDAAVAAHRGPHAWSPPVC